jgi:hypothetical protein
MLATFCLRLACGLVGALLILSPAQTHPRFYRVQFLTALGLTAAAAVFLHESAGVWLWITLSSALGLAFLGSLAWSLEGAPGGRSLIPLTVVSLAFALGLSKYPGSTPESLGWILAMEWSSAALLGTATTAMLMGHSYLIAPAMSLTPLLRLLGALLVAILIRLTISGIGLWFWTANHSLTKVDSVTMLLALRGGIGFVGTLILGVMAWQSARIRSTQSATGILYVLVIFGFLGELISQVLFGITDGGLIP